MIGNLTFDDTTVTILETIADTAAYLAVLMAPFQFYVILTQSKNLGVFKWLILNHSFWCLLLSFSGNAIKPVLLGGYSAYYCDGYIKNTSHVTAVIAIQVFQCFAMMAGGGVVMTVNYRYFGLYPGKIKDICYSARFFSFYACVHVLFIVICINGCYQILKIPYDERVRIALNETLELEPYTKLPTFVFIPYETTNVNLMLLLAATSLVTVVFIILLILLKKKVSKFLNYNTQTSLIISAMVQIIVTILFVLLPFGWMAFYLLFKIKIGGRIMLVCETFVACHALVEYITTLYVVLPYRKFMKKNYDIIRRRANGDPDPITIFTTNPSSHLHSHSHHKIQELKPTHHSNGSR